MSARRFLARAHRCLGRVVLAASLTVFVTWVEAIAADAARPNIVLLMADDQGWGDVGFRSGAIARTPNLDAMAANGLRLESFHAAAPVCSPTRGSVLTGRHPLRYGVVAANRGHLPHEEITAAEILREAGYSTGFFGKWHLGTLTTEVRDSNRGGPGSVEHYSPPWEHGFDVVFATEAAVPTYDPMSRPEEGGAWWNPIVDPNSARPFGTAYWSEKGHRITENLEGDDSKIITNHAIRFIERSAAANQAFFVVIWFHAPHPPVVADAAHRKPYDQLPGRAQAHFGSIGALDDQVGRLRERLRSLDIESDTLLWYTSDNGPEGPDEQLATSPGRTGGLRGRKRSLYEGGIRVPTVVEWPGHIASQAMSREGAVSSDILPTLLDLLGVRMPDDRPLDGVSLLPIFKGQRLRRGEPIAFEYEEQVALIDGDYKGIRGGRDPTTWSGTLRGEAPAVDLEFELYNLTTDSAESVDLASQQPQRAQRMVEHVRRWRASVQRSRAGRDYETDHGS